ncbi:MAG: LysM peptidoglycan-binding domain-containing protein [Egibacteraceae bacterium]
MDLVPDPARRRRASGLVAALLAVALAGSAHYVVRPGDTLSGIAVATGSSVADLQAANDLADPHHIVTGRSLRVGGGSSVPATATESGSVHVVAAGETLLGLAMRYGSTAGAIAQANGVANPNVIRSGQRLTIPVRSAPARGTAGGTPAGAPAAVEARGDIGALLESISRRYGMNPAFVKAVAWQESGWNPRAVSSANALGVMQVLPSTGQFVGDHLVGRSLDLHDPADNIEAGVAFLRYLYRLTGGDVDQTLAGYYQGLRSVRENGMYDDTRRYADNVKALRSRF